MYIIFLLGIELIESFTHPELTSDSQRSSISVLQLYINHRVLNAYHKHLICTIVGQIERLEL